MLGSINGYILSKWKFPGADLLFTLLLFGMFIPYQSILIPLVQVLNILGLYGTLPGLILAHVIYGIPITTLIFRNYYVAIPTELVEASRIDGAKRRRLDHGVAGHDSDGNRVHLHDANRRVGAGSIVRQCARLRRR